MADIDLMVDHVRSLVEPGVSYVVPTIIVLRRFAISERTRALLALVGQLARRELAYRMIISRWEASDELAGLIAFTQERGRREGWIEVEPRAAGTGLDSLVV